MRLEGFVAEATSNDVKKQWLGYVKSNPMLKNGVDIVNKITKLGYDAYIVGGSVRDIVLGINPKDIDIATNAPMEVIEDKFKTYDIGKSKDFGIVVVNQGGFQYEIAQFREDGDYSDGRKPDSVQICADFKGDAARRDFCINAMAIDADGNIIDYFDGQKALKNKVIKTVGNPEERFGEDYLRMMRAVRFASRLDFDIDPETKDAIKKHKSQLAMLSAERIKQEIWSMANQSGDKFANALKLLDELGMLDVILPEVVKMKSTKETKRHHPEAYEEGSGTVWDHVMASLKQNKIADPILNLSILMHDIGKPGTHAQQGQRHTYFGHAEEAKDIIDNIAKRLRLSNKERDSIMFAAVNHMKLFKGAEMKPAKIMKLVNDENWEILKAVSYCDDSCRVGMFDKKKFDKQITDMEAISKKWGDKTVNKVAKIIDGNRVMKLTGLRQGKLVGDIIRAVTDHAINNNIKSDKELDKLVMQYYTRLK